MSNEAEKRNDEYGADQIQILKGLEAVRKRPGMYIGSTSVRGLHHLVYEIVDNAVDEALAGFCNTIKVSINEGDTITVEDNGRGIPVGINHDSGKTAVEVVFTILHAGGKFGGGGYKVSGGLHGVGASVVNALSEWLEVEICREGKIYKQRYERGDVCYPLKEIGTCPEDKTGTKVTFKPDAEIFETTVFEFDILKQRLREMAFLTKNLRIELSDLRPEEKIHKVFHYEGGIQEFVTYLNKSKQALYENVMYFETGQGAELSSEGHWNSDQQTMECRCYGLARHYEPFLVNTVVGFIGPEYIYDTKQLLRAGLEDVFCGHLHGLPMGCDVCYTNHMPVDQNDCETLLMLLANSGCHYVMGLPQGDDIMLMYQSTGFQDVAAVRETFQKRPIKEFEDWMVHWGIWENGHLTKKAGDPTIFLK